MRLNLRGLVRRCRGCRRRRAPPGRGLRPAAATGSNGRKNVLLLIIDSLCPTTWGLTGRPDPDSGGDLAPRPRASLQPGLSRGDGDAPARRSIFTSRRILPFRTSCRTRELGSQPRLGAHQGPRARTFTAELKHAGYWTAQVSDNPFLAFTGPYTPFRETFNRWDTIVGQVGFLHPPELGPARDGLPLAARRCSATTATRPGCASTWPTRARA